MGLVRCCAARRSATSTGVGGGGRGQVTPRRHKLLSRRPAGSRAQPERMLSARVAAARLALVRAPVARVRSMGGGGHGHGGPQKTVRRRARPPCRRCARAPLSGTSAAHDAPRRACTWWGPDTRRAHARRWHSTRARAAAPPTHSTALARTVLAPCGAARRVCSRRPVASQQYATLHAPRLPPSPRTPPRSCPPSRRRCPTTRPWATASSTRCGSSATPTTASRRTCCATGCPITTWCVHALPAAARALPTRARHTPHSRAHTQGGPLTCSRLAHLPCRPTPPRRVCVPCPPVRRLCSPSSASTRASPGTTRSRGGSPRRRSSRIRRRPASPTSTRVRRREGGWGVGSGCRSCSAEPPAWRPAPAASVARRPPTARGSHAPRRSHPTPPPPPSTTAHAHHPLPPPPTAAIVVTSDIPVFGTPEWEKFIEAGGDKAFEDWMMAPVSEKLA